MRPDTSELIDRAYELFERHDATQEVDPLKQGVLLLQSTVDDLVAGGPSCALHLGNLAIGLVMLAGRTGERHAAEEAVRVGRLAVAATDSRETREHAWSLSNLSAALRELYKYSQDPSHLHEAASAVREAASEAPTGSVERALALGNLGLILSALAEAGEDIGMAVQAVDANRDAVAAAVPGKERGNLSRVNNLALALGFLYRLTGRVGPLEEAVELMRAAVRDSTSDDPLYGSYLANLGKTLTDYADVVGNPAPLHEAVRLITEALTFTGENHPARGQMLGVLALTQERVHSYTSDPQDLEAAVECLRVQASGDDRGRRADAVQLCELARLLGKLAEVADRPGAAEEAVQHARRAVALAAQSAELDRFVSVFTYTAGVYATCTGDDQALQEVVSVARRACEARSHSDSSHEALLAELAYALHAHSIHTGRLADLSEAVAVLRSVVKSTPQHHHDYLRRLQALMRGLIDLGKHTHDVALADDAVQLGRLSLNALPARDPSSARLGVTLAEALRQRFDLTQDLTALAECLEVLRSTLAAIPQEHPDRPAHCTKLAFGLCSLSQREGPGSATLDEAIALFRESAEAHPADSARRVEPLTGLCGALNDHYQRTGDLAVLQEAVLVGRRAIELTPDGGVNQPYTLAVVAIAVRTLARHAGDHEAGREAVRLLRRAVAGTRLGTELHIDVMAELGLAIQGVLNPYRFDPDNPGELEELYEEAVRIARDVLAATPVTGANYVLRLDNLAAAVELRQAWSGEGYPAPVSEAIDAMRTAVAVAPQGHPNRSVALFRLAQLLDLAFREPDGYTPPEEIRRYFPDLYSEMQGAYVEVAGDASVDLGHRLTAFRRLAFTAIGDLADQALSFIEAAADLMSARIAPSLTRPDREHRLRELADLPGEAAEFALRANRPDRAVELLERTRGLLTADLLNARSSDHAQLREQAPDLAADLNEAYARLESLSRPESAGVGLSISPDLVPGAASDPVRHAQERRAAYEAVQSAVGRIRGTAGFEEFLQAPKIDQIARHAKDGPIVMITTGPSRSDALIIRDHGKVPVEVVELPGLTEHEAIRRQRELTQWCTDAADPSVEPSARKRAQHNMLGTFAWLWDTIAEPVLVRLGYTGTPAEGQEWPRIWWCPTGHLTRMPLHAAGHHKVASGMGSRAVMDRVISSYTTTIRGLAHARAHPTRPGAPSSVVVPAAHVPGAALPGVAAEVDAIRSLIPGATVLTDTTRASVLDALQRHEIAHLACHGRADSADPGNSSLVLSDSKTAQLTITDITRLNIIASLAYLSACDTANAKVLPNESIHITGAFHLAGFQNVIGTLWPVDDYTAVEISSAFYGLVTEDGTKPPDSSMSSRALHQAVRRQRSRYLATPTKWAAHIHVGP